MYGNATGRKRAYSSRQKGAAKKGGGPDQSIAPLRGANFTPNTCRYIFNDDMVHPDVCGKPVLKGYSYCKEHKEICIYIPDPKRKRLKKPTNYNKRKTRFD